MTDIPKAIHHEQRLLVGLMEILPPLAEQLAAVNAALTGMECIQFAQLEEALAESHHYFRPTTVKSALGQLGWCYRQISLPTHPRKVGVWMKGAKP